MGAVGLRLTRLGHDPENLRQRFAEDEIMIRAFDFMQPDEAGEVRMISLKMPGSTSSGTALAAPQPHMPPAALLQHQPLITRVLWTAGTLRHSSVIRLGGRTT